MLDLVEIDNIEIRVLVNDQLDNIAPSWHPEVEARGRFSHVPKGQLNDEQSQTRGGAKLELDFNAGCCGAHGLSLMITAVRGEARHTLLFDAGPDGSIWKDNVQRLKLTQAVGDIEAVHLSHWHRDHSGGLEEAIRMILKAGSRDRSKVVVSLHPERPLYRGMMTPNGPVSIQADPSLEELAAAGASVELNSEDHTILDDMFFVSGEIPRVTSYETGFPNGIRLDSAGGNWSKDELIQDERFVMCKLKGKGLVVFTGCGHAGVVNTARRAVEVATGAPLFTVIGGFHLSDAAKDKLQSTVMDLKALKPTVLMPGHCSGWRFGVEAEKVMPGVLVPLYGGQVYRLSS